MTWVQIVAIFGSGIVAGFINSIAGGGSFIGLAALDFAGLGTMVANFTNRVAIEVQNLVTVLGFRSKGVSNGKLSFEIAVPLTVGAVVGALTVVQLPEQLFGRILGVAMILMLFAVVFDVRKYIKPREGPVSLRRRLAGYIVFFAVGLYGGAIQAGAGFLILAAIVGFYGMDLVHSSAHKAFVMAIYTFFVLVLVVFFKGGEVRVDWGAGLVLAAGEGLGGWIGSREAAARGEKLVRIVLAVMLAILALSYLGVLPKL